jgi:hypothetical protein
MSTRQYLRKLSVIVGTGASGLDFSDFRVTFSIRRGDFQTPNAADVRIYNVSDTTANRIKKEFTRLVIQAGYDGNFGLIFDGTIKQVRAGRIDQRDSYVDVTAADGDQAYNFSTMALPLAAGTKPSDAVSAFVQAMTIGGISQGYTPELSTNGSARGRVFYGMTRDELREWAEAQDVLWSIQDGKLTLIPKTSYIPGETPIISPTTGLVGIPEQTQNGIRARVLLNPSLKIGQRIQLDSTVNRFRYGLDVQSQASNALLASSIKTNADGFYYVMAADHFGDTRGNEWYTDLTCLAVDATVPPNMATQAAIAPEAASIKRF